MTSRFVFVRKYDATGILTRHKARFVVRGYLQGDVEQTFAPVVDFNTVRICITIAVQKKHVFHQMDVRTAFLHGNIDSEIFLKPPDGIEICEKGQVLQLRRGLYGLKQAPRLWQDKWQEVMKIMEFEVLLSDECVYRRKGVSLLLYVDDIIVIGPSERDVSHVKKELGHHLDVKDLGVLRSFLGVVFVRDDAGIWLSQRHYILRVPQRFGMSSCKAVATPMTVSAVGEFPESDSDLTKKESYQELLGCLLFLSARTRPDITGAVGILCRYSSSPRNVHWVALKRILRYLKGTVDLALRLWGQDKPVLKAYCDADWAGDRMDRKYTSGVLMQLGSSSVAWRSLKQSCVALSTTEAEFVSLSEGTRLVLWLRHLLKELDCEQNLRTLLTEDNQGAVVWGSEGIRHAKHISIRKTFVLDNVKKGSVQITYCSTNNMVADILTKPLLTKTFERHRRSIGVLHLKV